MASTQAPTMPIEEYLLGEYEDELEAFARRIGRPDGTLTVDEFMAFLDDHEGRRDRSKLREILDYCANLYATYPGGRLRARAAMVAVAKERLETIEDFREGRR